MIKSGHVRSSRVGVHDAKWKPPRWLQRLQPGAVLNAAGNRLFWLWQLSGGYRDCSPELFWMQLCNGLFWLCIYMNGRRHYDPHPWCSVIGEKLPQWPWLYLGQDKGNREVHQSAPYNGENGTHELRGTTADKQPSSRRCICPRAAPGWQVGEPHTHHWTSPSHPEWPHWTALKVSMGLYWVLTDDSVSNGEKNLEHPVQSKLLRHPGGQEQELGDLNSCGEPTRHAVCRCGECYTAP